VWLKDTVTVTISPLLGHSGTVPWLGGVTTCAVVSAGYRLVLPLGTSQLLLFPDAISRLGNQQLSRGSKKSGEAQGGTGRCQCLALPVEESKGTDEGSQGGERSSRG